MTCESEMRPAWHHPKRHRIAESKKWLTLKNITASLKNANRLEAASSGSSRDPGLVELCSDEFLWHALLTAFAQHLGHNPV